MADVPVADLSHAERMRIYGPWRSRTPADAAALFAGYPGRWWIAGGWAIEAFTGVAREHGDLDPSVSRADLPALRRHLAGRLDVWAANQETLRVLLPGDVDSDEIPKSCENVWLGAGGGEPWEYDVILIQLAHRDLWVSKRDSRISGPVDDIVWWRDGICYLRPGVQLLHKARSPRPNDRADFDAAAPLLDATGRAWLVDALRLAHPGHEWIG